MRPFAALVITIVLFASAGQLLAAPPEKTDAPVGLARLYMVMYMKGALWSDEDKPEMTELRKKHLEYLANLGQSEHGLVAGPVTDDGSLRGIVILRTANEILAKKVASEDPAVKAGWVTVDVLPWMGSLKDFKSAEKPIELKTYYIGLLVRGPKWTPGKTPEVEELQKKHLKYINDLGGQGTLVLAGPFAGEGRLRGIFLFKVDSIDEAKKLAEGDPTIQAGRLAVEMHPWSVPKGILP